MGLSLIRRELMRGLEGLLLVALGVFFILLRRKGAQVAARVWYSIFPSTKVWEPGYALSFFFVGFVFIVVGLLSMLGVISFRR